MARLPLSRFTVIDLTAHRAGPTATRQLADWGADVIRIEPPARMARTDTIASEREGPDAQNLHRNKRSMTLDLKTPEGKDIFFGLARRADVIVENYRSDVKVRLGIDFPAVRAQNPRIVYGSISGFGQDGPYATRPGVDQIAQGLGGLMSITGLPGGGPVRVGVPIADLSAGLFLAQGIILALLDRETTGEGQWVTTSLLEAQIFMLDFQAARWLVKHEVAGQAGNDHPTAIPTGVFPTQDKAINIAASGANLWERLCETLGAPELAADPRFSTNPLRSENRKALNERIAQITQAKPSAYWIAALEKAGVPCGPINTIDQVFEDPQVKHLKIARRVNNPELGPIEVVGQPYHLSNAAQPQEFRPTAKLGADTDAVLRELGYADNAIGALREKGVI
ncbi:MAG: CoA transferase [Candidatus Eremiobacteraeota bacterium]|nr:CoA transferase [Candidatus Eremiobacteraeota bacterium]